MLRAYAEIRRLVAVNAIHRKGFRIAEVTDGFVLSNANDEFEELLNAPNDPSELADLLGVLLHYAVRKGWTAEFLEELMLSKFRNRFTG